MSATPRSSYSLTHLSDTDLLCDLAACVRRDRTTTAELLAHVAEVERRKLYAAAGFSSMHVYCTSRLLFSNDIAYKRIRAARAARRFPVIYPAIADGRLNVSGVVLLAPKLTAMPRDEGRELIRAAMGKSKSEIEHLLAERFPQPDVPTEIRRIPEAKPSAKPVADSGEVQAATRHTSWELAPGPIDAPKSESVPTSAPAVAPARYPRIVPLSPKRYSLQLTMDESTRDKLRRAQELLGHAVPSGDVAQVLDRALDALIAQLEKRKFAKTSEPRPARHSLPGSTRYVPAHVRREVQARDGGQCTYVSETGHRCASRNRLEYDHIEEVARGGEATVDNIRLRCRVHNQYAAEQTFGSGFMSRKREAAQRAAIEASAARPALSARAPSHTSEGSIGAGP